MCGWRRRGKVEPWWDACRRPGNPGVARSWPALTPGIIAGRIAQLAQGPLYRRLSTSSSIERLVPVAQSGRPGLAGATWPAVGLAAWGHDGGPGSKLSACLSATVWRPLTGAGVRPGGGRRCCRVRPGRVPGPMMAQCQLRRPARCHGSASIRTPTWRLLTWPVPTSRSPVRTRSRAATPPRRARSRGFPSAAPRGATNGPGGPAAVPRGWVSPGNGRLAALGGRGSITRARADHETSR